MNNYFTTAVSYQKQNSEGLIKKVTENYLVDAMTFTEAEARIAQVMEGQEISLMRSARSNYEEVIEPEGKNFFYKVKIVFESMDDNTEKAKKTNCFMLVAADDIEEATELTKAALSGVVYDSEIESISKTKIIEVVR